MRNLFDLSGEKAIVTGGMRGLGRAMAEALSAYGCELVIMDVNPDTRALRRQCRRGPLPCTAWSAT